MSQTSTKTIAGTQVSLSRGDITRQNGDAIVNAANSSLLGGGGVDGAIHKAGGPAILEECLQIRKMQGGCAAGSAVITSGGKLAVNYVIHTVGPVWRGGNDGEAKVLASAYQSSLALAFDYGLKTVAFPSISTGAYGYPTELAATVALTAIKDFLQKKEGVGGIAAFAEIRFVLFDPGTLAAYQKALNELVAS